MTPEQIQRWLTYCSGDNGVLPGEAIHLFIFYYASFINGCPYFCQVPRIMPLSHLLENQIDEGGSQ